MHFAIALNGAKAGQVLTGPDVEDTIRADDLAWVHMQADDPETRAWIRANLTYLDRHAIDALLADETRSRATEIGQGALVILRGVNHNSGAEPHDMVSIRLWIDRNRIISVSLRRLRSVEVLRGRIADGKGPQDAGGFLASLIEQMNTGIETFRHDLDDATDRLEEALIDEPTQTLRHPIVDLRQKVIAFRRNIAPQRDEVGQMQRDPFDWLTPEDVRRLHEAHYNLIRVVEDLDAIRERLQVLKDELASILNDRLNKNMYILSIFTALFLPLGFLTGLFGVNLAGMPGAEGGGAFGLFAGALVLIGVLQIVLFRLMRWF
jgi:zinc transporter